jgi:hypothetical protein
MDTYDGWERWKTTGSLAANPTNAETTTLYIPTGAEIDVTWEAILTKAGYARVRWSEFEKGLISLWVSESALRDNAAPVS